LSDRLVALWNTPINEDELVNALLAGWTERRQRSTDAVLLVFVEVQRRLGAVENSNAGSDGRSYRKPGADASGPTDGRPVGPPYKGDANPRSSTTRVVLAAERQPSRRRRLEQVELCQQLRRRKPKGRWPGTFHSGPLFSL